MLTFHNPVMRLWRPYVIRFYRCVMEVSSRFPLDFTMSSQLLFTSTGLHVLLLSPGCANIQLFSPQLLIHPVLGLTQGENVTTLFGFLWEHRRAAESFPVDDQSKSQWERLK